MATKDHLAKPSQFVRFTDSNLKSPANFQLHRQAKTKTVVKTPSHFCPSKASVKSSQVPSPSMQQKANDLPLNDKAAIHLLSPKDLVKDNVKVFDDFRYAASQAEIKALQLKIEAMENASRLDSLKKKEEKNEDETDLISGLIEENKALKIKIEQLERNTFNEVKDVYEKYITLQKQHENSKQYYEEQLFELKNTIISTEEQYQKLTQESNSFKNENSCLLDSLQMEKENASSIKDQMHLEIKTLQLELEGLYREKAEGVQQHLQMSNNVKTVELSIKEKNEEIDSLKKQLIIERENTQRICISHTERVKIFEKTVSQLEEKLRQEIVNLNSSESLIQKQEHQLVELERTITQLRNFITESAYSNADYKDASQQRFKLQQQEIETLQYTCKTLQSTNEVLNVRLSALNETLCLQESSLGGVVDSERNSKLLNTWRQKVYSLLVKLKTFELSSENHLSVERNRNRSL